MALKKIAWPVQQFCRVSLVALLVSPVSTLVLTVRDVPIRALPDPSDATKLLNFSQVC